MARLVVITPSLAGSVHELGTKWVTLGRADTNTFQLVEQSVSNRHCEVCVRGEDLLVRDLLSTNGTFINDKKIVEGTARPGDKIRLGDVEIRYESSAPGTLSGAPFNTKMLVASLAKPMASAPAAEQEPEAVPEPADVAGSKFHVLFVDDSMAFLESFGDLCVELSSRRWVVHTAVSADRALTLLQQCVMDLVVLDIAMPTLDGLQLLGMIKRRHPNLKIVVLTGVATDERRAQALAGGAELFLEKPVTEESLRATFNVLNDLVSWQNEGFTGALRQVGLTEVIQMECNSRHSAILEIRNPELSGQIYIEDGNVIHATVGERTGEPAFYRLLALQGGGFEVKPFKAPPQRTIESRWEHLLMEAARVRDEETALINKPQAAPPKTPKPAPESPDQTVDHGLGDDIVVVGTYDGEWKHENDSAKPEDVPDQPEDDAAGGDSKK